MGSLDAVCTNMLEAHEDDRMGEFFHELKDNVMSMVTNVARCEKFFDYRNSWWASYDSQIALLYLFQFTGFYDEDDLCENLVYFMTQEEVGEYKVKHFLQ